MHMKKLIFGLALAVGLAVFFGSISTAGAVSNPWCDKLTGNLNPNCFPLEPNDPPGDVNDFNAPIRVIPHPNPTVAGTAIAISGNIPNPTSCIDYAVGADNFADGVWLTRNKGESWTRLACPADRNINVLEADMAVDTGGKMVILLGTWKDGVFLYKEATGECKNIIAGITHTGGALEKGHCSNYRHSPYTFANQCDNSDVCLELPDCGTDIKPHRWAVTGVQIAEKESINTFYIGIADTTYTDLTVPETMIGSGDHPGFYKTTDGGTTWAVKNTDIYEKTTCKLSDPFACPTKPSFSQTCAPSSISIYTGHTSNPIVAGMADVAVSIDPSIGANDPCTKAKVLVSTSKGAKWFEHSQGLDGTKTCTNPAGARSNSFTLASLSTTIASVSPSGSKSALGHLAVSADVHKWPLGDIDLYYQSRGVYEVGPPPAYKWFEKNTGFKDAQGRGLCNKQPCEPNPFTKDKYWGINAGPVSFKPTDETYLGVGIMFCGTKNDPLGDIQGHNFSGPYIYSPPDGKWINFTAWSCNLEQSPNQNDECKDVGSDYCHDSTAAMAIWSSDGKGLYSPIIWTDDLEINPTCNIQDQEGTDYTGDDGIYFMDTTLSCPYTTCSDTSCTP